MLCLTSSQGGGLRKEEGEGKRGEAPQEQGMGAIRFHPPAGRRAFKLINLEEMGGEGEGLKSKERKILLKRKGGEGGNK